MTMVTAPVDAPLEASGRILSLRRRYQRGPAHLSVERARYFTRRWEETEGKGLPPDVRVAAAMADVYEHMTIYVDRDDRIAGHWAERFLALPLPIERGEYNDVLANELRRRDLLRARVTSGVRAGALAARSGNARRAWRNQRLLTAGGRTAPLNPGLQTMQRRSINRFEITQADRAELLGHLLPRWQGHTVTDQLAARLSASGLLSPDMARFSQSLPGTTSRQVFLLSAASSIATIQGHVILDFDDVLRRGLLAKRAEVDHLPAVAVALDGAITFARRLAATLAERSAVEPDPVRRAELARMARTCARVPLEPATSFVEAVQSVWTTKLIVEIAHPINLHCFGRLDQSLGPFYDRDLATGAITEADARELLEELLLKTMSQNLRPESNLLGNFYHRYLGSTPVTVGGVDRDGADATNALTSVIIDAAHTSRAVTNINVRVHPGTPDQVLDRVARHLAGGTSSFAVVNDEVLVAAMVRRGFTLPDARDYAIMGCVEATCPGKTGSMSASALQLTRVLDVTLRNGDAALLTGLLHGEGLRTGDPGSFRSFDELLEAFFAQARSFIGGIVSGSNLRDQLYAEVLPAPMISAFVEGCALSGRDVTAGGATYDLSGISMINSVANVVDALHVIRSLVFEQRRCTLDELVAAVDDDFVGHEELHEAIQTLPGKWGNGDPSTDALAARVTGTLFDEVVRHRSPKGAPFVVYAISMIVHTIDGRLSIASADGRRLGTPFAASCNPANVERSGLTGVLRSVASLPNRDLMGSAVNLRLHPTAIGEQPATRAKWIAMVRTYFSLGGEQMQPTCVDAEVLRAAQRNPSDHRDLIVKVGGYSTYFVDLGIEIQDEIIARTEHR
jgi:formate C-acetyltransferase